MNGKKMHKCLMLNINSVARELQLSRNTIRRLINEGTLPAIRIGKQIRIQEKDFKQFIDSSKLYADRKSTEEIKVPSGEKLG